MFDLLRRHGLGQLGHGGGRIHVDLPAAFLHLLQHRVVAQAGRHHSRLVVGREVREHVGVLDHVVLAEAVGRLRLEQQEPGANGAVSVLEAGRDEPVFHHGHLGADLRAHRVGRAGVPHRIPDAAHALAGRARPEHVHRAARDAQNGLRLEDVDLVLAHREADRAGDLVVVVLVEQQLDDEHALEDVLDAQRLLGRLGDDCLIAFAVDHDLPAAGADRLAALGERHALGLLGLPDRQSPLLEEMDRAVHVAADVIDQVVAGDAHQVGVDHPHVIFDRVVADVRVDGGQAHRHRAGAVHGGLVDQRDLDVVTGPALGFERRAARGHAAANDQNVGFVFNDFGVAEGTFAHRSISFALARKPELPRACRTVVCYQPVCAAAGWVYRT